MTPGSAADGSRAWQWHLVARDRRSNIAWLEPQLCIPIRPRDNRQPLGHVTIGSRLFLLGVLAFSRRPPDGFPRPDPYKWRCDAMITLASYRQRTTDSARLRISGRPSRPLGATGRLRRGPRSEARLHGCVLFADAPAVIHNRLRLHGQRPLRPGTSEGPCRLRGRPESDVLPRHRNNHGRGEHLRRDR